MPPAVGVHSMGDFPRLSGTTGAVSSSYRTVVRPTYRVMYKTVTAREWKCCPGHSGVSCEEGRKTMWGLESVRGVHRSGTAWSSPQTPHTRTSESAAHTGAWRTDVQLWCGPPLLAAVCSIAQYFLLLSRFTYLKGLLVEGEGKDFPSAGSCSKHLQQPGLGWAEARSQELHRSRLRLSPAAPQAR